MNSGDTETVSRITAALLHSDVNINPPSIKDQMYRKTSRFVNFQITKLFSNVKHFKQVIFTIIPLVFLDKFTFSCVWKII